MKHILALILLGCGLVPLPPLPPLGCYGDMKPVCICDDRGECEWMWVCEDS